MKNILILSSILLSILLFSCQNEQEIVHKEIEQPKEHPFGWYELRTVDDSLFAKEFVFYPDSNRFDKNLSANVRYSYVENEFSFIGTDFLGKINNAYSDSAQFFFIMNQRTDIFSRKR